MKKAKSTLVSTSQALEDLNACCDGDDFSVSDLKMYMQRHLRPLQVLNLVFSNEHQHLGKNDQLYHYLDILRRGCPSRRALLDEIYNDERLQDTNYLRLPSLGKRVLASKLTSMIQKRYPWMSPRILHAYAFRPEAFSNKKRSNKSNNWGDLYQRVEIPKGTNGRRTLWIPNPPLRRVQRCLLELVFNRCLDALPEYVNGCRPSQKNGYSFGVYRNASTHLGQQYVAKFDIKNFFPSVHVNEIVPTLLALESPMLPSTKEIKEASKNEVIDYHWTHDAAVFIARLVTHRGRLPQGAPTSPAIANLVFAKFDKQICDKLGDKFVYSRYVDDLTISLSNSAAKSLGIGNKRDMLVAVNKVVSEVLKKSPFRLNQRKSKASSIQQTHRITGLVVSKDSVSLPRNKKRNVRALMHKIKKWGFVQTARELIGGEIHHRTEYLSHSSSVPFESAGRLGKYAYSHHRLKKRRLSTERMAVLMLKQVYGEIKIEIQQKTKLFNKHRLTIPAELHEGKTAWRDIERSLLPAIWCNNVIVEDEDGQVVIKDIQDNLIICKLRSGDKKLDFFFLSKRDAIGSVELWHQVQGLVNCLRVRDADECFGDIKEIYRRLSKCLGDISLKAPDVTPRRLAVRDPSATTSPLHLTHVEKFLRDVAKLFERIHYFVSTEERDGESLAGIEAVGVQFQRQVKNRSEFKEWITFAQKIFVFGIQRLPISDGAKALKVIRTIDVLADRLNGKRSAWYLCEQSALKSSGASSKAIEETESGWFDLQRYVVRELLYETWNFVRPRQGLEIKKWINSIDNNPWAMTPEGKLEKKVREFIALRQTAVQGKNRSPMFTAEQDIDDRLVSATAQICKVISRPSEKRRWHDLGKWAELINEYFSEAWNKEDDGMVFERKFAKGENSRFLDVFYKLRCRGAHGWSAASLSKEVKKTNFVDFDTIQKWAADEIGLVFRKKTKKDEQTTYFQEPFLRLTDIEVQEVQVAILDGLNKFLAAQQP